MTGKPSLQELELRLQVVDFHLRGAIGELAKTVLENERSRIVRAIHRMKNDQP